jgi:hypothetical protein
MESNAHPPPISAIVRRERFTSFGVGLSDGGGAAKISSAPHPLRRASCSRSFPFHLACLLHGPRVGAAFATTEFCSRISCRKRQKNTTKLNIHAFKSGPDKDPDMVRLRSNPFTPSTRRLCLCNSHPHARMPGADEEYDENSPHPNERVEFPVNVIASPPP